MNTRNHAALIALALGAAACGSTSSGQAVESYIQTADGQLIHYEKVGSGPQTLLVPGKSWVAEELRDLAGDRTVVFYDARGRGRSAAAPSISFEEDLEDLETVRAWFGAERVSLLGFDYWGALVLHYARRHPERVDKVVVSSPIPMRKFPYWDIYMKVYDDRADRDAYAQVNEMRVNRVDRSQPEAYAKAYTKAILAGWVAEERSIGKLESTPFVEPNVSPERAITLYLGLLKALGDWDWREDLRAVRAQTLFVFGSADPMPAESLDEWAACIPGAQKRVIAASGRLPWLEARREFLSAVEGFLEPGG
jgi:pimeloyl-ACP methyl ester carboxylesterase